MLIDEEEFRFSYRHSLQVLSKQRRTPPGRVSRDSGKVGDEGNDEGSSHEM